MRMIKEPQCPKCFLAAFRRGVKDASEGRHACPYRDKRGGRYANIVTFSRAYQHYWRAGHDAQVVDAATPRLTGGR